MLKRKQPIVIFAILIVILVLELLPYGAVLHFGNPEGEPLRETFSYFDMTPYGYANFGPFITAILTCILLVTSFVNLLVDSRKLRASIRIVSVVALLISLAPLLINCYSVWSGAISLLLLLVFIISSEKEVG